MTSLPVHVNGTSRVYATDDEAAEQVARWIGQAIRFAKDQDGTWCTEVDYRGTSWHVHAYDTDRQVDVVQRDRRGQVYVWTSAERRACEAAAFPS